VPLVALAASFWSASASAQTPPPPPADDEDLEVPASATPAATPSPTVPAPTTNASSAASTLPEARPASTQSVVAEQVAATPTPVVAAAPTAPAPAPPPQDRYFGLRFSGYVHGQYQRSGLSEDQLQQGGAPLNQNQFMVRRARLRVDRTWDYASASVELDANTVRGPRVGIRRAEASLFYRGSNAPELPPLVALTAGVMDIPFGYELGQSARVRWFMERSVGNLALFPTEPDVGAKVWGAVSFFRYAVALMNGEPVDDSGFPRDPNNAKDAIARFGAEGAVTKGLSLSGGTSFAYGKGFHAGQGATKSSVIWVDANEDGTQQAGEFFGVPGSAAVASENFKRWAIALDLGASLETKLGRTHLYGEAFVASNYDRGFMPSDPVTTGVDARQAGGYVALTHELEAYGMFGFRAAVYDPNSDIIETRGGKTLPKVQTVKTFSPLVGLVLPGRARLLCQYDFVRDYLARDEVGVPTDADNDQLTFRLQVEL
jgi:Phosphate-selective porin O and P